MEPSSKEFLKLLINKEEEYITKFLETKIEIEKETEQLIKELKEKYDQLWIIEKEDIDKESYSVERRESALRENILWDNYYELINLSYILDKRSEEAIIMLIDFFLKAGSNID